MGRRPRHEHPTTSLVTERGESSLPGPQSLASLNAILKMRASRIADAHLGVIERLIEVYSFQCQEEIRFRRDWEHYLEWLKANPKATKRLKLAMRPPEPLRGFISTGQMFQAFDLLNQISGVTQPHNSDGTPADPSRAAPMNLEALKALHDALIPREPPPEQPERPVGRRSLRGNP